MRRKAIDWIVFAVLLLLLTLYSSREYLFGPICVWVLGAFVMFVASLIAIVAMIWGVARAWTKGRARHAWPVAFIVLIGLVLAVVPSPGGIVLVFLLWVVTYLPIIAATTLCVWPIRQAMARLMVRDRAGAASYLCGVLACGVGLYLGPRLADFAVVQTVGPSLRSDASPVARGSRPRATTTLVGPWYTGVSIVYDDDVSDDVETSKMSDLFSHSMRARKIAPHFFVVADDEDM